MAGMFELKKVAIRLVSEPPLYSDERIRNAGDAVRLLGKEFSDYDREIVCVVNMNARGEPINMNQVCMGTGNRSVTRMKDIFKAAILSNADSILLLHNHPSGRLTPSKEDFQFTEAVRQAGAVLQIPLLDHVILGRNGQFFSFMDHDLLIPGKERDSAERKAESERWESRDKKEQGMAATAGRSSVDGVKGSILAELRNLVGCGEVKAERRRDMGHAGRDQG